jgi:hypothetical protein
VTKAVIEVTEAVLLQSPEFMPTIVEEECPNKERIVLFFEVE